MDHAVRLAIWWEKIKRGLITDDRYNDLAHILIGIGLYFLTLFLIRKWRGAVWLALLPVFTLQLANETLDLVRYYHLIGLGFWLGSIRDSFNTLAPPLALAIFLSASNRK